ncbi:VanZ family protein [Inconstantimicrobium mannanitabidum]|uniref:Permease n=1 Tax=Inconstantimicrobium mannanitabidum TaxID=1604901 RepID=A0ACB5RAJ0_9CLOT|nr:VanZ family protein [Clostridium sp. TW13]GKX66210.1 permease [Clostridium sp. TW13]
MSEYIFPIKIAIICFPFIALIITLPFLIYQYRKHGYINIFRAFLLYSFLLYLLVAYYLIILPLPKTRDVLSFQKPNTQHIQLKPFRFITEILKYTQVHKSHPKTYLHIFKERAFLQAAFNAILLTPLGIYLSYYFNKSFIKTVFICFCTSLFFELTQLSGLYGYYNAPYRLFDVDDLFLNTLGGAIGYMISPIFKSILPNVRKLDEKVQLELLPVGFIRRGISLMFDWGIFIVFWIISREYLKPYIFVFLYFILLTYFTNGRTFGKWLLRVRVAGKGKKLKFKEVLVRYTLLYYVFFGMNYLAFITSSISSRMSHRTISYFLIILIILIDAVAFLHLIARCFSSNKRLIYEKISRTTLKIT